MYLMNLMNMNCMTRADLSRISGVPDSTLRDILSGKAQIDHCAAATIYSIADALDTSVEDILDHYWEECLSEDDEKCEREAVHDEHTLALFYHLVDVTVKARHDEDDRAVADCFNSSTLIEEDGLPSTMKRCAECQKPFMFASNRQKCCNTCQQIVRCRQSAQCVRKYRA